MGGGASPTWLGTALTSMPFGSWFLFLLATIFGGKHIIQLEDDKKYPMNRGLGPMNRGLGPMNPGLGPTNRGLGPTNCRLGTMNVSGKFSQ